MAQPWTHTWGGSGADSASAVARDSNGNLYVVGNTSSFGAGASDALLVKYDTAGNFVWARTWGGTSNDYGAAVAVDSNNDVYVVGGTDSFGAGWRDALLLKFSSAGGLLWARTWGGASFDAAYDIAFDAQGDVYLAGETYSYGTATVLLKFSSDGTFLNSRTWKGPGTYDSAYSIDIDGNGNILLAGINWDYSVSPNHNSILLLKYDSQENLTWGHLLVTGAEDEAWGQKVVRADAGGNIYVSGRRAATCQRTGFSTCNFDNLLLKLDPNGNQIWATTWGGSGWDSGVGMAFDSNGDPVVSGITKSFGATSRATLLQYDTNGNLARSSSWVGSGDSDAYAVTLDQSDDVYVVGSAPDNTGSWQNVAGTTSFLTASITSPAASTASPEGVVGSPSGVVGAPTGVIETGGGGSDAFVARTSEVTASPEISSISPTSGIQGRTLASFTVAGNNFQPTSTLSFSGTGLTVASYVSRTTTQIVANISIALGAATGARDVIVTNPDGQTATGAFTVVPLTLSVCPASSASCAQSLSFAYQQGAKSAPSAEILAISTNGPSLTYTASASTTDGTDWLLISPSGGSTPSSISVSVAQGLPYGTYTGLVTISAPNASNSPQTVLVNLSVGPAPPTLPAPGYGGISQEEAEFRQVLSGQKPNFPLGDKQDINGGDQAIWSGLDAVLGNECQTGETANGIFLGTHGLNTVCAGQHVAAGHFVFTAFLNFAEQFFSTGLDLFGPTTSIGGKTLLAGTKVFVATVVGPDPKSQLVISSSEELLAPMLGRLVGDYLSPAAARFTENTISQKLSEDQLVLGKATSSDVNNYQRMKVTATVAWAYNPFTHYVVAFISTNQYPGTFYAVYYEVDNHGLMMSRSSSGLPVSETLFSCPNSCTKISH